MIAMFSLKIKLGNDAMQSREDVASALRVVADKLDGGRCEGFINDANGNNVGKYNWKD